jgi:hypothetical protein
MPNCKSIVLPLTFVPPFSCLYTYWRDAAKFWVCLAMMKIGVIVTAVDVDWFIDCWRVELVIR